MILINFIGKPNWTVRAWKIGVQDGLSEPYDLGSGMTYECVRLNAVYDMGANFGQWLGQRRECIKKYALARREGIVGWWRMETRNYDTGEQD